MIGGGGRGVQKSYARKLPKNTLNYDLTVELRFHGIILTIKVKLHKYYTSNCIWRPICITGKRTLSTQNRTKKFYAAL